MNKKVIVPLVIVAVAVVAGAVWYGTRQTPSTSETADKANLEATTNETTPPQNPEPGPMPPPAPSKTAPAPSKQTTLSYDEALKKYGTNRIQFDTNCQAKPTDVTYKSGTQVMFDNRANTTRKIVFNGKTYTIAAYGYTVVSMTNATYPAVAYIDCNTSQNVAKVVIQK